MLDDCYLSWAVCRYVEASKHLIYRLLVVTSDSIITIDARSGSVTAKYLLSQIRHVSWDYNSDHLFRIIFENDYQIIFLAEERFQILKAIIGLAGADEDSSATHRDWDCACEFVVQSIDFAGASHRESLVLGAQTIQHHDPRSRAASLSRSYFPDVEQVQFTDDDHEYSGVSLAYGDNAREYYFRIADEDKLKLSTLLQGRVHLFKHVHDRALDDIITEDFDASSSHAKQLPRSDSRSIVYRSRSDSRTQIEGKGDSHGFLSGSAHPSVDVPDTRKRPSIDASVSKLSLSESRPQDVAVARKSVDFKGVPLMEELKTALSSKRRGEGQSSERLHVTISEDNAVYQPKTLIELPDTFWDIPDPPSVDQQKRNKRASGRFMLFPSAAETPDPTIEEDEDLKKATKVYRDKRPPPTEAALDPISDKEESGSPVVMPSGSPLIAPVIEDNEAYISNGAFLLKYVGNGRGKPHKRYFKMDVQKGFLSWAKAPNNKFKSAKVTGVLQGTNKNAPRDVAELSFTLTTSKRALDLVALSHQEYLAWTEGILSVLNRVNSTETVQ